MRMPALAAALFAGSALGVALPARPLHAFPAATAAQNATRGLVSGDAARSPLPERGERVSPQPGALHAAGEPLLAYAPAPFGVGEVLAYSISYLLLEAGTMRLAVEDVEDVSGRPAYHLSFRAQTNATVSAIYSLKDQLDSWMDVERLHSLRFVKESEEKGKRRSKRYRLDQDRHVRINEETGEESPMPPGAQDDVSILYFLRTLPLESGKRFTLSNLLDPDDNPMRVTVLGSESVRVPAGKFNCWVMELDVRTDSGVFAQGGELKAWLTKDARRTLVKLESKLGVGSFTAQLTEHQPGEQASASGEPRKTQ
jgi:hypothetical protein